jgi:hypothetical protein
MLRECDCTRAELRRNKCGACAEKPTPPLDEQVAQIFKYINGLGTNKKFGHVFRRDPKPRINVLGSAISNLLLLSTLQMVNAPNIKPK